jgi:alpha-tubulin suppressor-like RCC1 family protein
MTRRHIAIIASMATAYFFTMTLGSCDAPRGESMAPVSIEIRFQPGDPAVSSRYRGLFSLAYMLAPTDYNLIERVLVDVSLFEGDTPIYANFDLEENGTDGWRGNLPLLPRDRQLRFIARALNAAGDVAFSGETLAVLAMDHHELQIPLSPAQDQQTIPLPRILRIAYPTAMISGQEEQMSFTFQGNAGAAIAIRIAPAATPNIPAPELSPATATVTLTNSVADFVTVYTPPEVATDTDLDYRVTITASGTSGAVAITSTFRVTIKPTSDGTDLVRNARPRVLFNPVIRSLTANSDELPSAIELIADVSDDSLPAQLSYQWSFTPSANTPAATFANNGVGNPGHFQNYLTTHQGTITLAVTDEHAGTTTLHYELAPDQFVDVVDHDSVNGTKGIVAGRAHTCVLTGSNHVRCWGDNQFGQLGYGNTIDIGDAPDRLPYQAGDVPLPPLDPVKQLVAGANHSCVLLRSGLVVCWGNNSEGQLGYDRTDHLGDGEPVMSFGYVTLGGPAVRIAAGGDHTCAILQSGALRCWGANHNGQLGHGNTTNLGDDETVASAGNVDLGPDVSIKDLALGGYHTCALLSSGAVRCWGANGNGQLGYGHSSNLGDNEAIHDLPNISLTGRVRKLVAGAYHTCALTEAGTLRCWGYGGEGQLGQEYGWIYGWWGDSANELPSTLPGDINTGAHVTDVASGDSHVCALSSDGRLKCWGRGNHGQLGYGDFTGRFLPPASGVDLDGVTTYRITAGESHTCALRSNGTARCWGDGTDGRLGLGSTAALGAPTGDVDVYVTAP